MALNKQVWVNQLMKNFYHVASFLTYVTDLTSLVENNKLHVPEMGADPDVLINNTTYPVEVTQRVDTDHEISLDIFDTKNTMVRNVEAVEMAYDKLETVNQGHKDTLMSTTGAKAAHAYAPSSNTEFTPILLTTGENDGTGRKKCLPKDVMALMNAYDDAGIPDDGQRYLVLCSEHLTDLMDFDLKSFKDITDIVNGQPKKFAGFNILKYSDNPRYNPATLVKSAFGSLTGRKCSFSFHKKEVMKADGTVKLFSKIDDPEQRATIIGYQKRFIALPLRNKGVGAIVSDNA